MKNIHIFDENHCPLDRSPSRDGPLRPLCLLHERLRPPRGGLCPANVPLSNLPQGWFTLEQIYVQVSWLWLILDLFYSITSSGKVYKNNKVLNSNISIKSVNSLTGSCIISAASTLRSVTGSSLSSLQKMEWVWKRNGSNGGSRDRHSDV